MEMQNKEKSVRNLEKRFVELSRVAYQRDIITFSDFLNLEEQNILHMLPEDKLFTRRISFGGYEYSERQMTAFIPDALYLRYGKNEIKPENINYPFCAVRISPLNKSFTEKLSHRDYLGAVLNMGIERSRIGDILPGEMALVFVHNDVAELIVNELTRIRHTSVKAEKISTEKIHYTPCFEEIRGTVASVRLDSLLALAFSGSRTKLSGLIESAKVYVNGRLITSNGYQLQEGDIVSVRGFGKFRYDSCSGKSRKNRLIVTVSKYM